MTTGREGKPSNWNVPNALTTLRILMVPFFGWALLVDGGAFVNFADAVRLVGVERVCHYVEQFLA